MTLKTIYILYHSNFYDGQYYNHIFNNSYFENDKSVYLAILEAERYLSNNTRTYLWTNNTRTYLWTKLYEIILAIDKQDKS